MARLAGNVKVTIGCDGDIYIRAVRTADVLFGWRFDCENLAQIKHPAHAGSTFTAPALII